MYCLRRGSLANNISFSVLFPTFPSSSFSPPPSRPLLHLPPQKKTPSNEQEMRFKLVPKKIKEEDFWRNYFYRVSLIKQSVALHSMSNEEDATAAAAGGGSVTADGKNNADEGGKAVSAASAEETSVGDVADEMNAIGDEEEDIPEWEKELQRELQEYEVRGEA